MRLEALDLRLDFLDRGWIASVLSTRAWATVGMDERITIKAGDDGATNTTDGTHYSTAGMIAAVAAWQDAMGY